MNKQELYDQAKEAYYNGEEIMTDLEFDELEEELGLENHGYVGTHHQKSYTVKHSFIMGSLSKVQIKEDENHNINWDEYTNQVMSYLGKSLKGNEDKSWFYEGTPKFDGCSFEVVIDNLGNLVSVSTRGDGEYGADIKVWFEDEWKKSFLPKINDSLEGFSSLKQYVVRGECLISKTVFNEKYSNEFKIPRGFVAGVLNQDWEGTEEQKKKRADISWVCYDYRVVYENGTIEELDYNDPLRTFPGRRACCVPHWSIEDFDLKNLYEQYENVRNIIDFPLDGFVLKPGAKFRLQDGGRARQEDCVAINFLPEIVDATLIDVEWNVGKSGEYYPTGILAPIILGGKETNRVSLANYGKIIKEHIGIGSHLKISLAGDIIPYCYKVESSGDTIQLPEDSYVDGVHLMKTMSITDRMFIKFLNSVKVLKPDGIGEAVAEKLFNISSCNNIVSLMFDEDWKKYLDDSKSSQNIIKSLDERRKTLTLPDLIQSMGYENCGEKNALWLAKKWSGHKVDTKGIPTSIIELSESKDFNEDVAMFVLALDMEPLKEEINTGKIPVILTGSPKECGYNTKSDFLNAHPEYVETTKWNECKILFTDDLNSTSSKMEKAKKNGVEIRRYGE